MSGKPWDMRCGRWQDAMADVTCDALIVDAPYSGRVHDGHRSGIPGGDGYAGNAQIVRNDLTYASLDASAVREFVASWHPRTRGWFVSITDHELWPAWRAALESAGRYVFAPVPLVETGSRVRLCGDGPSSWTCWLCVARPRCAPWSSWGTLPGAYIQASERKPIIGGKPLTSMRAIVRDYSRPGDVIADPCAGAGTTLIAACQEGRTAIGAEMDPTTANRAVKRLLRANLAPPLFHDRPPAEQSPLDLPY